MSRTLTFISLFILISCGQSKNPQVIKQDNTPEIKQANTFEGNQEFLASISKIPTVDLPIFFYCGADDGSAPWAKDFGDDINAIAPWCSMVVGLLPIKNNKIYIIYAIPGDILYPYLYTYDKSGHVIDSMYLHIGYCAGEAELIWSTATRINKDYSIDMFDTLRYMDATRYISLDDPMYVDSIIVTERKMKLDINGIYNTYSERKYPIHLDSTVLFGRLVASPSSVQTTQ